MEKRDTVGKIWTELKSKEQDKVDVHEFVNTTQADFMPRLVALVEENKRAGYQKDFYIEACYRLNKLMPDVMEVYFKSRHTCPTPFYDRSVFRYDFKNDRIQYLWHVPSLEECNYYIDNILSLRPDEREAAQDVLRFRDGDLLRLAKDLNGETADHELIFYRKDQEDDGKRIDA
jgi:hypothetical protein